MRGKKGTDDRQDTESFKEKTTIDTKQSQEPIGKAPSDKAGTI